MKNNCLICSLLFASGIQNAWGTQITDCKANPDQAKPNIILIMCDDMGFSDLSCYGGEVHTPHIDFLAENGIRFSQFKNTGRSCPSRAALLPGNFSTHFPYPCFPFLHSELQALPVYDIPVSDCPHKEYFPVYFLAT